MIVVFLIITATLIPKPQIQTAILIVATILLVLTILKSMVDEYRRQRYI